MEPVLYCLAVKAGSREKGRFPLAETAEILQNERKEKKQDLRDVLGQLSSHLTISAVFQSSAKTNKPEH